MDNFDGSNFGNQDLDKPIPFDNAGTSGMGVSHSPLDLGGGGTAQAPKIGIPGPVAKPKVGIPGPAVRPSVSPVRVQKSQEMAGSGEERIEGVKTFFTKLHPGAIAFLDEQIAKWLRENPGVTVKRTNVVTGEIQAKKTEPNIIITIWY
ncbi:MAG: hypothetical protein ABIF19_18190 [Planctomycetota bacterium]